MIVIQEKLKREGMSMKKTKEPKNATPAQVEGWKEEIAKLRAEIGELRKDGDRDALNAVVLRLEAIEKKLSEAPAAAKKIELPGGVEIDLPRAPGGSAQAAKPAKEKPGPAAPAKPADDGGIFS